MKPSERISSTMIPTGDDTGYMFGGVHDLVSWRPARTDCWSSISHEPLRQEEDEDENEESDDEIENAVEKVKSYFYNDLYKLDLVNHKWSLVNLK